MMAEIDWTQRAIDHYEEAVKQYDRDPVQPPRVLAEQEVRLGELAAAVSQAQRLGEAGDILERYLPGER